MKKNIFFGFLFLSLVAFATTISEMSRRDKTVYKPSISQTDREVENIIKHSVEALNDISNSSSMELVSNRKFEDFREAIGMRESSGDYKIINQYGYVGKYQFGRHALFDVGVKSKSAFIKSPKMQDEAFLALCEINKYRLRNYLPKYVGKTINGIHITESGLIAASHLVGAGSVKKYLRSNGKKIRRDANQVSLEEYIKLFNNYNLNINAKR